MNRFAWGLAAWVAKRRVPAEVSPRPEPERTPAGEAPPLEKALPVPPIPALRMAMPRPRAAPEGRPADAVMLGGTVLVAPRPARAARREFPRATPAAKRERQQGGACHRQYPTPPRFRHAAQVSPVEAAALQTEFATVEARAGVAARVLRAAEYWVQSACPRATTAGIESTARCGYWWSPASVACNRPRRRPSRPGLTTRFRASHSRPERSGRRSARGHGTACCAELTSWSRIPAHTRGLRDRLRAWCRTPKR
jgi:hypothetical protein